VKPGVDYRKGVVAVERAAPIPREAPTLTTPVEASTISLWRRRLAALEGRGRMPSIHDALIRAGLVREPLEPHEFERGIHLLFNPAGPTVASVPNIVTPSTSARCTRDGCDRPRGDAIHRLPED
jgi:hypothetical protein